MAAKEAGHPICVSSAGVPSEVLFAMDVYPIYPESLAAISAGIGKADEFFDEDCGLLFTVELEVCILTAVWSWSVFSDAWVSDTWVSDAWVSGDWVFGDWVFGDWVSGDWVSGD